MQTFLITAALDNTKRQVEVWFVEECRSDPKIDPVSKQLIPESCVVSQCFSIVTTIAEGEKEIQHRYNHRPGEYTVIVSNNSDPSFIITTPEDWVTAALIFG